MENSNRIKQITDASLITAIYMVILFISKMTGSMLEYELFFAMPIPMVVYSKKHGLKASIIPLMATFALSFCLINYLSALTCVLPSLIVGELYGGWLLNGKCSKRLKYLVLTSISVIKELLVSIVFSQLLGIENIYIELQSYAEDVSKIMLNRGFSISETFIASFFEGLVPFFIVGISLVEAFLIMLISSLILPRLKLQEKKHLSIIFESRPKSLPYIYIVTLILGIISLFLFGVDNKILHVFCVILINSYLIFSLYYLYVFWTFIIFFVQIKRNRGFGLLMLIIGFLIFPLGAFAGAISDIFHLKEWLSIQIIKQIQEDSKKDKE